MKKIKTLHLYVMATVFTAGLMASPQALAQAGGSTLSDFVIFGPASNPGGIAGFIQASETNASEFFPAFLPAPQNNPVIFTNNIGIELMESSTQTNVSDQLWIQNGFWYFASDPNLIDFQTSGIQLVAQLLEDGTQQDVSTYFGLPVGSMSVMSDVEAVPEPTTLALAGAGGLASLMMLRRRK
jgi:hypothetical protein